MKRTLARVAAIAIAVAFAAAGVAATPAHASAPPYVTIQLGRAMEGSYVPGQACTTPVPGILTQPQIAADLASKGLTATDAAVVAYTGVTEQCKSGDVYASWSDLQAMVASGWAVVSAGLTYQNVATMTPAQQQAEVCGSLPAFTANGIDASGMFAYPNNSWSLDVQLNVTIFCFNWGRTYGGGFKGGLNVEATQPSTNIQRSNSVTGGACSNVLALCYATTTNQKGKHYQSPAMYAAMAASLTAGAWLDLQFYKLVTGTSSLNAQYSWDCSSADPTLHWTSEPELYCQSDFDAILAALPAGTVSASPAQVAAAWGRVIP